MTRGRPTTTVLGLTCGSAPQNGYIIILVLGYRQYIIILGTVPYPVATMENAGIYLIEIKFESKQY